MTEMAPITVAVITRTRLVLSHLLRSNQVTTLRSPGVCVSQILFHGGGCLLTLLSPAVLTLSKGLKAAVPTPPKKSIVPSWVSVFSPRLALRGFPFSLRVLPFVGFHFLSASCPLLWDSRLLLVLPPCPSLGTSMNSQEVGSGSHWLSPVLVCVPGHTTVFERTAVYLGY